MYYPSKDDYNPYYAPHIGPAAMPSPHSRTAPYFSGHSDTFEDFLEQFEDLAHSCKLTGPERVDAITLYVASSLYDSCRRLSGYHLYDWDLFRHSLIYAFGSTISRHKLRMEKLRNFVDSSSRHRMTLEADVSQYYQTFFYYSATLVHSRYLTNKNRDAEFWSGFHPHDREVLRRRLFAQRPFQPLDIPFPFEDVYHCAHVAFAYEEHFPFRSQELQFKPRSISHEDPFPSYPTSYTQLHSSSLSSQELHSPSFSTPYSRPPASCLPTVSEIQRTTTPSETNNKPKSEPEDVPSITSLTSLSLPVLSSLESSCISVVPEHVVIPCTDVVAEPEPEPESTPSPIPSLPIPLFAGDATESVPTPPLSSIAPVPTSIPSDLDSKCPPSLVRSESEVRNLHAEPEPERRAPTTFVPEPPSSLPQSPSTNDVPEFLGTLATPTFVSLAPPSTSLAPSEPTLSIPSTLDLPPRASSTPAEYLLASFPSSLALEISLSPEISTFGPVLAPSPDQLLLSTESESHSSRSYKFEPIPAPFVEITSLYLSELPSESSEIVPLLSSQLEVSNTPIPTQSTPQEQTLGAMPLEVTRSKATPSSQLAAKVESLPSASASILSGHSPACPLLTLEILRTNFDPPSLSLGEIVPTLPTLSLAVSSVRISFHLLSSPPLKRLTGLMQDDPVSVPLEATPVSSGSRILEIELVPFSPTIPSISQPRPLGVTSFDSASSPSKFISASASFTVPLFRKRRPLEVTQQVASSPVPQRFKWQEPASVYEVFEPSSMFASGIPDSSLSQLFPFSHSSLHFIFAFSFFTVKALVLTPISLLKTFFSHARKIQSKNEDLSNSQNGNLKSGYVPAPRLQPAQFTQHVARFVFDPGGIVLIRAPHKITRGHKSKTYAPSSSLVAPPSLPTFYLIFSLLSAL